MRLKFHPEAEFELIQAALYYDQKVKDLGDHYKAEVRHATEVLMNQPLIGRRIGAYLRQFFLRRFLFRLIYSVTSEVLRIEAVAR
jgi:plasmid stabilization system protein ParE